MKKESYFSLSNISSPLKKSREIYIPFIVYVQQTKTYKETDGNKQIVSTTRVGEGEIMKKLWEQISKPMIIENRYLCISNVHARKEKTFIEKTEIIKKENKLELLHQEEKIIITKENVEFKLDFEPHLLSYIVPIFIYELSKGEYKNSIYYDSVAIINTDCLYLYLLRKTHQSLKNKTQASETYNDWYKTIPKNLNEQREREEIEKAKENQDISILKENYMALIQHLTNEIKTEMTDNKKLIQAGINGFEKALEKWNVNSEYRFFEYALWNIRTMMTREKSDQMKIIRIPTNIYDGYTLRKIREKNKKQ